MDALHPRQPPQQPTYLKASGTIADSQAAPTSSSSSSSGGAKPGLLHCYVNFPTRGRLWRVEAVCFDGRRAGEFCACDERGQVYAFSLTRNEYSLIRHASTPIAAMAHVTSRAKQLVVAHENGDILVVDTTSGDVLAKTTAAAGYFHATGDTPAPAATADRADATAASVAAQQPADEEKGEAPPRAGAGSVAVAVAVTGAGGAVSPAHACARLVRTHPTKPLMVTAADDRSLSLWDLQVRALYLLCAPYADTLSDPFSS